MICDCCHRRHPYDVPCLNEPDVPSVRIQQPLVPPDGSSLGWSLTKYAGSNYWSESSRVAYLKTGGKFPFKRARSPPPGPSRATTSLGLHHPGCATHWHTKRQYTTRAPSRAENDTVTPEHGVRMELQRHLESSCNEGLPQWGSVCMEKLQGDMVRVSLLEDAANLIQPRSSPLHARCNRAFQNKQEMHTPSLCAKGGTQSCSLNMVRHTLTRPSELSHHFRPTLERSQEDFIVFEAPVVNNPHAKVATHKKEENCEKRSAKGVNNVVDKESQVLVQLKVKGEPVAQTSAIGGWEKDLY